LTLLLGNNQIAQIPELLGQLSNLTQFDLNGNQITFITDALGQLSNLDRFSLNGKSD
jgi:Leucine-rich repeat (LRR) protein